MKADDRNPSGDAGPMVSIKQKKAALGLKVIKGSAFKQNLSKTACLSLVSGSPPRSAINNRPNDVRKPGETGKTFSISAVYLPVMFRGSNLQDIVFFRQGEPPEDVKDPR
ncbi:hypothetical protein GOODEAATRI_004888 [Goodea atripinnis]|uniref:Uncharacterized protein n=1 Tax=Goodea atripinnis TaxID=208336 RepID=A0ABV0P1S2_9TELE